MLLLLMLLHRRLRVAAVLALVVCLLLHLLLPLRHLLRGHLAHLLRVHLLPRRHVE